MGGVSQGSLFGMSFESPNYYAFTFLSAMLCGFLYLQWFVYRLEQEQKQIRSDIVRLSQEEIEFDKRVEREGMPPFVSWRKK